MAKKGNFAIDFEGFLDYADRLDRMGREYLKQATENAMTKSKDYMNQAISDAMDASTYHFNHEQGSRSTGRAKDSLRDVASRPIEWDGNICIAYVGPDLKVAPEAIILAMGDPHLKGDQNLKNAMKAKGKYGKEKSRIQQEEFEKVIEEAMKQ